MAKVAIIGGDGFGGFMQTMSCAHFAKQNARDDIHVFYPSNPDKAEAIKHIFPSVTVIPEEYQYSDNLDTNPVFIERFKLKYGSFDKIYYHCPNLLYQNNYKFNYKRYKTHPLTIKQHRNLTHLYNPSKKIYIAHISTTNGYSYPKIVELIANLAARLPEHQIIVPVLNEWAGHKLDYSNITNHKFSDNVIIKNNPTFIESIKDVCSSEYSVCLDNGINHLSWNLGQPNILLDGQYMKLPWMCRWKESFENCVSLDTPPEVIAKIVEINIKEPISCLIDRKYLFNVNSVEDFNQKVYLKSQ